MCLTWQTCYLHWGWLNYKRGTTVHSNVPCSYWNCLMYNIHLHLYLNVPFRRKISMKGKTLKITGIKAGDYGKYQCRMFNGYTDEKGNRNTVRTIYLKYGGK